ncbi:MAG TPA: DUF2752 domain-containing protein [Gemmatimonadota bacterium]
MSAPAWSVLAGAYAAGGLAVARFAPGVTTVLPPCPFRALTGLPCPTCGTTRAMLALANGHPGAALLENPLAIAVALTALAAGVWGLGRLVAPGRVPALALAPDRETRWARLGAVAVLLNWAYLLAFSPLI